MKRLSLQWRITLMTAALIGVTCVLMNCLIGYSGKRYMDAIGSGISAYGEIESGAPDAFDPQSKQPDDELTIIISGAQAAFGVTNWYITAAVTLIGGVLAYFVSGRALRPLRSFAAQVENIQPSNLAQCKVSEDVLPEFQRFSRSFNGMIDRLDAGFTAQRQFTGNAAHELRTPPALMQAQLELFSAEHADAARKRRRFEPRGGADGSGMAQMTKIPAEMSELHQSPGDDRVELAPMIEEIFTDLAPLAESKCIALEADGGAVLTGSDPLLYRLLFNLTENAIRYGRRPDGAVRIAESARRTGMYRSASVTTVPASRRHTGRAFSSRFSAWTSRAAGHTAASGSVCRLCGRLPRCMAARCRSSAAARTERSCS